jgi:hypothetical protein
MREHNFSEDTHRCKSCGASLLKSDGELILSKETAPLTRADACSNQGELASLREKALLIREEAIEERENDLHRREELFALQQGRSFALRVQEISDAQIAKVAQECRLLKLKEANECLVIESQIRDEGNRQDQCRDDLFAAL